MLLILLFSMLFYFDAPAVTFIISEVTDSSHSALQMYVKRTFIEEQAAGESFIYCDINDTEWLNELWQSFNQFTRSLRRYAAENNDKPESKDLYFYTTYEYSLEELPLYEREALGDGTVSYHPVENASSGENIRLDNVSPGFLKSSLAIMSQALSSDDLAKKKVCLSALLAFYIIKRCYNDGENAESALLNPLSIIGYGLYGSQIAHMVSYFLEMSKRSPNNSLAWFIVQLTVCALPLSPVEKGIILGVGTACYNVAVELRKRALLACEKVIGFNPLILDQFRDLLHYVVSKSNFKVSQDQLKIKKLFTVGATFVPGSFVPNLKLVELYCNFYTNRSLHKTFVTNTLTQEFMQYSLQPLRREWSDCSSRIFNYQVLIPNDSCCRDSFKSISYAAMMASRSLASVLKSLIEKPCFKPGENCATLKILDLLRVPQTPFEIVPVQSSSAWYKFYRWVQYYGCCGCCFRSRRLRESL